MNLRNSFSDLHCDHLLGGQITESLKKNTSLDNSDFVELISAAQMTSTQREQDIKKVVAMRDFDTTGVERKNFESTTL